MKIVLTLLAITLALAIVSVFGFAVLYNAAIERAIEVAAQDQVAEILKDKQVLKIICSK